jgi:conjugal transfer/entry exclusion protein
MFLEENIRNFHKKLSSITEVFNEKFNSIEKKIQSVLSKKDEISSFYTNKLNDVETILKKNEGFINNTVENKLNSLRVNLDSK